MKKILTFFIILLTSPALFAQTFTTQWKVSLGGSGNEYPTAMVQTTDGGYIVVGNPYLNNGDVSGNHGSYDYWVVKLSSTGIIQWQKSLGGTGEDIANSIIQTNDGGYAVAGYSTSNNGDVSGNHGNRDFWVVKLNSSGVIQWQKSLGGADVDYAYSIIQINDVSYVVAGYSYSNDGDVSGNHGSYDYWIVKLNGLGVIQWQKSLGGAGADDANSIIQTTDGGYLVSGYSNSNDADVSGNHGAYDYWVVKLNNSGVIQWQKSLGGVAYDLANSIVQSTDGGYIAVI